MLFVSDENYVLCSGLSETMHIFDIRQHLIENIGQRDGKKRKKSTISESLQWASKHQNEATKLRDQEKKKLRKLEKKSIETADTLVDGMNFMNIAVSLTSAPLKVCINFP